MRIGVTFPTHEIGTDPAAIRAYAQAAEALGYSHISAYDHLIGADPVEHPGFDKPYTVDTPFHEPLTLFGFLAACTTRIGFTSAVLVLPMRQTVLVAKQAAEVDILSGGRLRLGVGLGRYDLEYRAMGADFRTRGRRIEDQAALLRALWTRRSVTLKGADWDIAGSGINPLPVQRPIPLWFGGSYASEAAMRRIARVSDGWLWYAPPVKTGHPLPAPDPAAVIGRFRAYVREAGRDPAAVPLEGRLDIAYGTPEDWQRTRDAWRSIGAVALALNTMDAGFTSADQHIARLEQARNALA